MLIDVVEIAAEKLKDKCKKGSVLTQGELLQLLADNEVALVLAYLVKQVVKK